ncbi:kinase [Companilactobacillus sp. RD055328]|uniref:PfkB family carbohydrate kinase n=1 Tax=Companilactobacillus sp. RD055328 TaxID=2916634 RepID=UPI001FC7D776|nr:PfkB family carbohydrate kinase [Companilactobacillus sp. RD055328]GKQ42134.1 kinase [Companilactobacillus sp. RD055328]
MTTREDEILKLIKLDPLISQNELSQKLGITRSGVATHIHNLTKKGLIKGRGYLLTNEKVASVIGGINIDTLGISSENLITYNSNPGDIIQTIGGAGRNMALALTKFSVPNNFISVYGDDINGDKFVNNSHENNMNIECCERINGQRTSSFLYVINTDGERFVAVDDMKIYDELSPAFLEKYINQINQSKYCIIDTNISEDSINYLSYNVTVPIIVKTVSLNKNHRILNSMPNIDTLVTTKKELVQLIVDNDFTYLNIKQSAKLLLKMGVKNLIVFDIKEGLCFYSKKQEYHIKNPSVDVSNSNGSNAVLTAAIVWGLSQGLTWKEVLKLSYTAAVISSEAEKPVAKQLSLEVVKNRANELFK